MQDFTDSSEDSDFPISEPWNSDISCSSYFDELSANDFSEVELDVVQKKKRRLNNEYVNTSAAALPISGPYSQSDLKELPMNVIGSNFTESPGLKLPTNSDYTILDFFQLLFDKRIYEKIIIETNTYADQKKARDWVNLSYRELSAFFGMIVGISSRCPVHELDDIWSSDLRQRQPYFANIMTRFRFIAISSCLHFNSKNMPNIKSKDFDRVDKLGPIIDYCNENFKAAYQMHREVAVDEVLIKFTSSRMKQYELSKPLKKGFKWWMCADSHNGYVSHMKLCTGKDTSSDAGQGLGTLAVLSVVLPYLSNQNHIIFCDRYFTSVQLAKELSANQIYCCGTLNANRKGIPDCIKKMNKNYKKEMNTGDSHFVIDKDSGLQFLIWMDKTPILMLTNAYPPVGNDAVKRKHKDGTLHSYPCPPAIKMYNCYMGGVELANKKRLQYGWKKKSNRWEMRPFWHCFDTAVTNAFILYSEYMALKHKKTETLLNFRKALSDSLINGFSSRMNNRTAYHVVPHLAFRTSGKHSLVDLRKHNIPKRKNCVVCLKKKLRHESFFGCVDCGSVTLCQSAMRNCFTVYHSESVIGNASRTKRLTSGVSSSTSAWPRSRHADAHQ